MKKHIITSGVQFDKKNIPTEYIDYLKEWRENAFILADGGDVAASICLQAVMIDLVLNGKCEHDWPGIMNKYLMDDDKPIAYSQKFGTRLSKFEAQYKQSTIQAIHSKWWIESVLGLRPDHCFYAHHILKKKQTDGLFYDRDISETILRHRMKTEITMATAMSAEILSTAGLLSTMVADQIAVSISDPAICPPKGYMSMEYFRSYALKITDHLELMPTKIEDYIKLCSEGLKVGWCDFSMTSKTDAYMGTAHRTERDRPIHSPLIACQVKALFHHIKDLKELKALEERLNGYAAYLNKNPKDIPAFQMRDVAISFGPDRTPIEVICASELIENEKI